MKSKIIKHIKAHGPLSLADYMAMCLYDPKGGYYTHKNPFGKEGDFITAPELTPLFGEMLGLWVADTWAQMAKPEAFNLIELGPGRGVLAADMLRAISKAAPACLAACHLHLVEISPHLKALQAKTLQEAPCPVTWHQAITTTPQKNSIVIGNELLDALPVNQYQKGDDGLYYERLVTLKNNELTCTLAPKASPINPPHKLDVIEESPAMNTLLQQIKEHLKNGIALFLDYGTHVADNLTNGDTLQAIRNHRYEDIFASPGEADLTWHIPFQHIIDIMGTSCKLTDMGLFLTELGLPVRAEQAHRAATSSQHKEFIESTTQRLLDPNQMGRHFKALCWQGRKDITPSGFLHLNKSE